MKLVCDTGDCNIKLIGPSSHLRELQRWLDTIPFTFTEEAPEWLLDMKETLDFDLAEDNSGLFLG